MSREEDYKKLALRRFKDATAQIESSQGKDLKHDTITDGIHSGDAAMGRYGIMPNTVDEFANRFKDNPDLQKASEMSDEDLTQAMETNPEFEDKVATPVMQYTLDKYKNPRAANYAHQFGHNLSKEDVLSRMEGSIRDDKFQKVYEAPLEVESMEALDRQRAAKFERMSDKHESEVQEEPQDEESREALSKLRRFFTP